MRRAIFEDLKDTFAIRSKAEKILVGVFAFVVVASLAYAIATGSPFAVGALFGLVGLVIGYFLTYLATYPLRQSRRSLAGRLIQGYVMITVCILGFGIFLVLPDLLGVERTASGFFIEGIGYGTAFAAIFRLARPVNSRVRSE